MNSFLICFTSLCNFFMPQNSSSDMETGASPNALTVEEVFRDLKGRRAGMIKALTTDFERCYQLCDPERENLCLYGYPDGNWAVSLPADEVPSELPEPALGINFARDGMHAKEWASLVAVHSDSWLLSVAFFYGARFEFRQTDRMSLFDMINDLPTIFEVIKELAEKQKKTKASVSKHSRNKFISKSKEELSLPMQVVDEEDGDGQEETLCGACDENDGTDEFWICCDACEKWFHGKCVKITAARAEHIKHYKCPSCSNKRPRQ